MPWRSPKRHALVDPTPILVHETPDSILTRPSNHPAHFIGNRARVATCSGVAWFHGNHLATINLAGNALHTYRFGPEGRLEPLQAIVSPEGFDRAENLAFAPDGRWLVTTNSRDGAVHLFRVDPESHRIDPRPRARVHREGDVNAHGIGFSPCSRFFAYTTVDEPGWVRVCEIRESEGKSTEMDERVEVVIVQSLRNRESPLKPKGVDFSSDGRFVALCHAANAARRRRRPAGGRIFVHRWDAHAGRIEEVPLSKGGWRFGLRNPDDVRFFPDGSHLVVTSQAADTAAIVDLDAASGRLRRLRETLRRPVSGLDFPHGVGISRDGRHLAIANYGDDRLRVFAILAGGVSP